MLDSTVKQQINNARDILVGKIPDPKGQIDQITNALIYKFMDDQDRLALTLPGGKETFFVNELKPYAWHKLFDSKLSNQEKADLYIEGIHKLSKAKHLPELFRDIFKDAFLPFRAPDTIAMFLGEINKFDYKHSENLGNAFEYLLSFLSVQGDLGSFRTPRNIIEFIVDAVAPQKEDTILDPACGTAGFLIEAYKHITQDNKLSPNEIQGLAKNIHGIEIDPGMAKIARVNLYLHGFKTPHITEDDTLSNDNLWGKKYDVILANPPFMSPKGGIVPHDKFGVNSKRAEVLFTDYIAEHLKLGGRAGVVVPEGVIFQSGTAYKQLRKMLIEDNYLWAVISLPSGVFNPYAGVKTSVLLFDRARAEINKEIMFFQVNNDGYSLGAQRREITENDLPEALEVVNKWKENKKIISEKVLYIEKDKIRETGEYKLSIDNYKEAIDYSNVKWPVVKIMDIVDIVKERANVNEYPYLEIGDVNILTKKYFFKDKRSVVGSLLSKKNDLVISKVRPTRGAISIVQEDKLTVSGGFSVLRASINKVSYKYLFSILSNSERFFNYLGLMSKGATYPTCSDKDISKFKIPLPPLDVQQKIVEEIDRYQNIIDGAEKIIANWKPNFDIDPGWERVRLGEISKIVRGGSPRPIDKYITTDIDGINWIKIGDVAKGDKYIVKTKQKIKKEGLAKTRTVKNGDFILSNSMSFGRPYIVKIDGAIHDGWLLIRISNENKLLPDFLYEILGSDIVQEEYKRLATGGVVKNLNSELVKNVKIHIPPIETQRLIVEKIEIERELIEHTKTLININKEKIKNIISKIWN